MAITQSSTLPPEINFRKEVQTMKKYFEEPECNVVSVEAEAIMDNDTEGMGSSNWD